jgi:hypothetical protein
MGVSPLAPAWYVLALALVGLALGIWLRQDLNSQEIPPRGELKQTSL